MAIVLLYSMGEGATVRIGRKRTEGLDILLTERLSKQNMNHYYSDKYELGSGRKLHPTWQLSKYFIVETKVQFLRFMIGHNISM